jgi:DNA (cytosine-5)-methyltransferase 1
MSPTMAVDEDLTTTHLLCGAGGDTQGFHEAGFTPVLAANQDRVRSVSEPFGALTTGRNHSIVTPPLLVPCGGGWAEPPMSALHEPMRTRTANPKGFEALVTPGAFIAELRRNGTARSVGDPLATIAAGGTHHALVMPYYRTGVAKPAGDPFDTFTVRDRFAVVSTGDVMRDIDDAFLRMVQPRESLRGQRFPDYYRVLGNKGQQTAQAGNAVSVNVAKWIGLRIRVALDRTAAAA